MHMGPPQCIPPNGPYHIPEFVRMYIILNITTGEYYVGGAESLIPKKKWVIIKRV